MRDAGPAVTTIGPSRLSIRWADGTSDEVTARWLRDACHCAQCRVAGSGQRHFDPADLPAALSIDHVAMAHDGTVVVDLDDGHQAHVPARTLAARQREPGPVPWGAQHLGVLQASAVSAQGDLEPFARALAHHGVALAYGLPVRAGAVLDFAAMVGFVRETNYGRLFDVKATPDPSNLAYTAAGLPLHSDNPYRDPVPTVQLLHCLVAAPTGGETRLADGFRAAATLATEDADAFDLLTSTGVAFRYADAEVDLTARHPIIELDDRGRPVVVRMNNRSMQPPDLPATQIDAFYAAYTRFARILADTAAVVELTLEPGWVVAFDNRRVLHARGAYPANAPRHLQGCYIDIDAVASRARLARTTIT
ncbi:MAG: TauD/TfdA family dioxygenase [Actinomycetota bacterium]